MINQINHKIKRNLVLSLFNHQVLAVTELLKQMQEMIQT